MLHENASEVGLPTRATSWWSGCSWRSDADGRRVSALKWGEGDPEVVFVHGGAQNAHTWDTVVLASSGPPWPSTRPATATRTGADDHAYWPPMMAPTSPRSSASLAPDADLVVGCPSADHVLPGRHPPVPGRAPSPSSTSPGAPTTPGRAHRDLHQRARDLRQLRRDPDRTDRGTTRPGRRRRCAVGCSTTPRRTPTAPGRGATTRSGTGRRLAATTCPGWPTSPNLWEAVDAVGPPLLPLRGGNSGVVGDEDVEEFQRRQPQAEVVVARRRPQHPGRPAPRAGQHLHDFITRTERT